MGRCPCGSPDAVPPICRCRKWAGMMWPAGWDVVAPCWGPRGEWPAPNPGSPAPMGSWGWESQCRCGGRVVAREVSPWPWARVPSVWWPAWASWPNTHLRSPGQRKASSLDCIPVAGSVAHGHHLPGPLSAEALLPPPNGVPPSQGLCSPTASAVWTRVLQPGALCRCDACV